MGGRQWEAGSGSGPSHREVEHHTTQGGARGSEVHAVGHMHRHMSGPQMEGPIWHTGELRWRGRREEGKLYSLGGEVVVWGVGGRGRGEDGGEEAAAVTAEEEDEEEEENQQQ